LGAPQTIWNSSLPVETTQTFNFSASGCLVTDFTSPTTTPGSDGPAGEMPSISRPAIVNACASAGTSSPVSTQSRTQLRLIFIASVST
jgi:hypothetical protein